MAKEESRWISIKGANKDMRSKIRIICGMLFLFVLSGCSSVKEDQPEVTKTPISTYEPDASYITVTKEELDLPEVEREYHFLFLADTHISVVDDSETDEVKEYAASRAAGFVNTNGKSSMEQFSHWIEYANEMQVDAVLFGGDIVDNPSKANVTFLKESLEQLNVPYLFTVGNHDWTYPWDYFTENGFKNYLPEFDQFMNGNTDAAVMELEDLILLSVDDSTDQVSEGAMNQVKDTLTKEKPVLLMLHVPLATENLIQKTTEMWGYPIVLGTGGIEPSETSKVFLKEVLSQNSNVAAVLAGHIHFPDKANLTDSIVQYVASPGYEGKGLLLTIK